HSQPLHQPILGHGKNSARCVPWPEASALQSRRCPTRAGHARSASAASRQHPCLLPAPRAGASRCSETDSLCSYRTPILVDLERHRIADLLPDRSADGLNTWLQQHPTIQTINRDRCGTYADGANRGAPEAVRSPIRFHLVLNLSAAVERVLERQRKNWNGSRAQTIRMKM